MTLLSYRRHRFPPLRQARSEKRRTGRGV